MKRLPLFTEGQSNTKLAKSEKGGEYLSIGLFLAPYTLNGTGVNLCPFASAECVAACLNTAGNPAYARGKEQARKRKALEFLEDRAGFVERIKAEIARYVRKAERLDKRLVVRLNGTSDIDYPLHVFESFPNVIFYDYSKSPYRMRKYLAGSLPSNYHLTFSFSGENLETCKEVLSKGGNVSVVFSSANFPSQWEGFNVIDGDKTDLRFLDGKGVVVGLKAKGKARKANTGGFIQIGKAA